MALRPGDTIDRYTIVEALGHGGMGAVYRARDARLDRIVALKILLDDPSRPESSTTPSSKGAARILREARAAAALAHPNVVEILDVGEADAPDGTRIAYLAMELVRGSSLRTRIAEGSLSFDERVLVAGDIARALAAAHAIGIVHRDIKPENVMLRDDGTVKVLDFGIAKRTHAIVDPTASTEARITVTAEGVAIGTPYYMSPEQMRGEAIDARADQFAWGVVAYEILAGSPPWGSDLDAVQLVTAVLTKTPERLDVVDARIPARIATIVARAMEKTKENRFASMDDLVRAWDGLEPVSLASPLAQSVQGASFQAPIASVARTANRGRVAIAAAIGVALLASGIVIGTRVRRAPQAAAPAPSAIARCTSSAACTQSLGALARCRDDGACVALASEDCEVQVDKSVETSDDTVWFGALLPTKNDPSMDGTAERRAIELARQDFDQMMSGLSRMSGATRARPFGVVMCNDADAVLTRAARHLIHDVRVPAIIGFRSAAQVTEVGTSLLIPNGVLGIASLVTSPLATRIPTLPGQPRMFFRTTYSSAETAKAMGRVVPSFFEAQLRQPAIGGAPPVLARSAPMRVAFVRMNSPGGAVFAELLFKALRFNGKSAVENGADYKELVLDGSQPDAPDRVAEQLRRFAPHVVILVAAPEARIVDAIERDWTQASYRPRYLLMTSVQSSLLEWIGRSAERRRRVFGLAPVSTTGVNARFVMHYNETTPEKVTRAFAPNSSYDAFYLLAYATYALDNEPITGTNLARAIARLLPPGKPIDVGPGGIFDAYATLRRGESIDLNGALGSLDFDLATGEAKVDQALLCPSLDDTGAAADSIESGILFKSADDKLEGTLKCP